MDVLSRIRDHWIGPSACTTNCRSLVGAPPDQVRSTASRRNGSRSLTFVMSLDSRALTKNTKDWCKCNQHYWTIQHAQGYCKKNLKIHACMASAGAWAYYGDQGLRGRSSPEADDVFMSETLIFDASVIVFNKITINDTHAPLMLHSELFKIHTIIIIV